MFFFCEMLLVFLHSPPFMVVNKSDKHISSAVGSVLALRADNISCPQNLYICTSDRIHRTSQTHSSSQIRGLVFSWIFFSNRKKAPHFVRKKKKTWFAHTILSEENTTVLSTRFPGLPSTNPLIDPSASGEFSGEPRWDKPAFIHLAYQTHPTSSNCGMLQYVIVF